MRTNLKTWISLMAATLLGIALFHELPALRGQQTVVDIPTALPQGVVVAQPITPWRYQAVDTSARGLVLWDTATGQAWFMSGAKWDALPPIPRAQ